MQTELSKMQLKEHLDPDDLSYSSEKSRKHFIWLPIILSILFLLWAYAAEAKPNILVIYTDDQNYRDISYFGGSVYTPNMARLFQEGLVFSNARVTSPACTPSRYSLHTGLYASKSAEHVDFLAHIEPDVRTIGLAMKEAGYRTGFIGKWHLGVPNAEGDLSSMHTSDVRHIREVGKFDFADRIYIGNPGKPYIKRGVPKAHATHNMEWLTEGALDFMSSDSPYFLVFAPTLVHVPQDKLDSDPHWTPAGRLEELPDVQPSRSNIKLRLKVRSIIEWRKIDGKRAQHSLWLDDAVGELIKVHDGPIILMSDNGTPGKATPYDAAARVPMTIYWPGVIEPGESDELVTNLDIFPTVVEWGGGDIGDVDGLSLAPIINERKSIREHHFIEIGYSRAIVSQKWKLIVRPNDQMGFLGQDDKWIFESLYPAFFEPVQLYNLQEDPAEKTLAKDPKVFRELYRLLEPRLPSELRRRTERHIAE